MNAKKVYLVDVGVLLEESAEEFSSYNNVYDKKHGYYDENQFYMLYYDDAVQYVDKYVSNGVDRTYGVVSETYIDANISDKEVEDTPVEGEDYSVDSIEYSVAKFGKEISKSFIQTKELEQSESELEM